MLNSKEGFALFIIALCLMIGSSMEELIEPCLGAQECKQLDGKGMAIQCSEHGKCFYDLFKYIIANDTSKDFLTCVCDEGYTDYGSSSNDGISVRCCYQQKSQFTAFILEVIPGFGAGHYYIGNMSMFLSKCIIICSLILAIVVIEIFLWCKRAKDFNTMNSESANGNNLPKKDFPSTSSKIKTYEMILNNLIILLFAIIVIWQIIDTVLFGLNYYLDSNNMALKQW